MVVKPNTFNQRLTSIRQYLAWYFNVVIDSLPSDSQSFDQIRENKNSLLDLLESSFINAPPTNRSIRKGLNAKEIGYLTIVTG
jgi:hypothetical protein